MDQDWTWAVQDRYPGFCLTFVRDRDPEAVAELFGSGPLDVLTAEQAGQVYPPSRQGSLLRCGTVPGWTFCYEGFEPVGFLPSLQRRLSAGSELVQTVRGGDGMNLVSRMVDGVLTERFEPYLGAWCRGAGPRLLQPSIERILSESPGTSGLIAALRAVGGHVGATVGRRVLDGPLLTGFSTFPEPAPPPRPRGPAQGLGRCIGVIDPAGLRGAEPTGRREPPGQPGGSVSR